MAEIVFSCVWKLLLERAHATEWEETPTGSPSQLWEVNAGGAKQLEPGFRGLCHCERCGRKDIPAHEGLHLPCDQSILGQ